MIANLQEQSFLPKRFSDFAKAVFMAEDDKQLIERLTKHVGVSASEVARQAGLTPSTLTRPLHQPVKHRLSTPTLDKLKAKWPDFAWNETAPVANAVPFKMEGASSERMRNDVPIYGTALGAPEIIDGEAIEQTTLNSGDVVTYARRPVILNGRADVYGLFIQGSSMAPRHEEGDVVYVDPKRTARVGEDVVVYLRPQDEADDGERAEVAMIKRLVRTTASYVELEQFTPAKAFRIDRARVLKTHRVIPWRELLS